MSDSTNPMLIPRATKVTINIGVGEAGSRLQLAEKVLEILTGQKPVRTLSTQTNRDQGTSEGASIAVHYTHMTLPTMR